MNAERETIRQRGEPAEIAGSGCIVAKKAAIDHRDHNPFTTFWEWATPEDAEAFETL